MFISETQVRVRYAETDQMGVVYHANFFLYYEVSRAESIRKLGLNDATMEKMGLIMPIAEVHSKFLKPAFYDDLLTVKSILKEIPINHKIEFHHEVHNEKGETLAKGKALLYFMELKTMKPTTIPAKLLEKLKPYFS